MMTFGEKLRQSRQIKKMTQKQLADLVGAKHNSVSDWENNKNKPDPDTIELLCGVLEISPNYLLNAIEESFSLEEIEHIKKYRVLDKHGKEMVDFTLLKEWERVSPYIETVTPSPHVVNDDSDYLRPVAAHNDYITDDEELQNTKDDIAGLKRPD